MDLRQFDSRPLRLRRKRTPPSDSGSEAAIETPSPSISVGPLPIVAALRHWSLQTPTDGEGDEAAVPVQQRIWFFEMQFGAMFPQMASDW